MPTTPPTDGLAPSLLSRLVESRAGFLSFLERRVGDPAQAEEILQQAFVRALEKGHTLADDESATAWFYRLLRNALVDHYRRRGAHRRALEAVAREPMQGADPELMQTVCACVRPLIGTLEPDQAEMLRRVDLEGAGVAEAGRALGITASNAGVRLHRARKALHERLVSACGACATHGCLDCHCKTPVVP